MHSNILDAYYSNNAGKLHRIVDKILLRFGGLSDKDLMHEYLGIPAMESEAESEVDASSILEFVRENAASYATNEDIDLYKEVLDTLSRKLDASSVLLEEANKPSLVALVAYSFQCDVDLDNWFVDFNTRNDTYIIDQKKNYIHMKEDLKEFVGHAHAA